MPKLPTSAISKVRKYTTQFPKEFQATPKNELYCTICEVNVNHEKRSTVQKHRESAKHQKCIDKVIPKPGQSFISLDAIQSQNEFTNKLVTAFLSANIPIYKVNNPELKYLFTYIELNLPSVSACRSRVNALADGEVSRIKQLLIGKKVILIIDESEITGKKFFNTLIGSIDDPTKTFMVDCRVCEVSADCQYVVHLVDDVLKSLDVDRNDFALLLSDAARYMTAAGNVLKVLYPHLLHVTCITHLLHNCAEKVRAFYNDVDNVIARVKAATVKNKDRMNAFQQVGKPPQPVLTRWTTWLRAAMYYADNLPVVKTIVNNFSGDGLLVSRAKEAVAHPALPAQLLAIKKEYECLIPLVEKSESQKYDIITAYNDLMSLDFAEDSCSIKQYIGKRLEKNSDFIAIATLARDDISPSQYLCLQRCQVTSVSVERSFSMLNKLLCKDRPFRDDNIKNYLIMYYNTV